MNQFFIEPSAISDGKIIITGSDVKHIQGVLRLRIGEELQCVCPSDGLTYYCSILEQDKNHVTCSIGDVQSQSTELPADIVLFQGLPKGDKLEFVIQKAVEMGVARITPVSMKRSVMKIDPKKAESKQNRWQAIAESAASQSKRGIIPEVTSVKSYKEAVKEAEGFDMILLPYELAEGMDGSRQVMDRLKNVVSQKNQNERARIGIFIGPEGGFDQEEIELAKASGAEVITLGKRILRTETAPIAILAWITYVIED